MGTTRGIKLRYWSSLLSQFLPLYQFWSQATPHASWRRKSLSSWPQAVDQIARSSCQRAGQGVTAAVQQLSTTPAANTPLFQPTPTSTCHNAWRWHKHEYFIPMSSPLADSWANEAEHLLNSAFCCTFYESEHLSPSHSLPLSQTQAPKSSNINTRFWGIVGQTLQSITEPPPKTDNHCTAGVVLDIACPAYTLNPLACVPLLVQRDEPGKSVPMWLSAAHHLQREQTAMCTFVAHDSIRNFRQPKKQTLCTILLCPRC